MYELQNKRSNPLDVLCKKCALKNFTKFLGKYRCWSLFFKKRVQSRVFLGILRNFSKTFRTTGFVTTILLNNSQ